MLHRKLKLRRSINPFSVLDIAAGYIALAAGVLFSCGSLEAQQPPRVGYVFPPGIQAGESSEVVVGGYDWTPDMQFFLSDNRAKIEIASELGPMNVPPPPYWFGPKARGPALPIPREYKARITVPSSLAGQTLYWQVANANGASTKGQIVVTPGQSLIENEERKKPMLLEQLPATINARLARFEEIDRFHVRPPKAGPITCQIEASQLGSPVQAVLRVHDDAGKLIVDAVVSQQRDPSLSFHAAAKRTYTVSVHDLEFRGSAAYVYRLTVTPGPRVVAAIPSAGKMGTTPTVAFVGYGVATGRPILEAITRKVHFPGTSSQQHYDYRLSTDHGDAHIIALGLSEHVELSEERCGGKLPMIPCAVTGTLDQRGQIDRYKVPLAKGQTVDVHAIAMSKDVPLDTSLILLSPDGKQLASNDDANGTTNAYLKFKAANDGIYEILVSDIANQSGRLDSTYRLVVKLPSPSLDIDVADHINLPLGAKANLKIIPKRIGGVDGDIAIEITGLPPEISVPESLSIPPKTKELKVPLTASPNSSSKAFEATIIARAQVGGRMLEVRHSVLIARTMKPRAKVTPVDKDGGRTVHRGTTYPAEVIVERLEGFNGPVILQMASQQGRHRQGITSDDVHVPSTITQTLFPVYCPEWLETDRTSRMVVNALAVVPDPKGEKRFLLNKMEGRITMSLEGALLSISGPQSIVPAQSGKVIHIPITISRSPKLREAVILNLHASFRNPAGVVCEPTKVEPNQTTAVLKVTTPSTLTGFHDFVIQGVAMQDGKYATVSQTKIRAQLKAK